MLVSSSVDDRRSAMVAQLEERYYEFLVEWDRAIGLKPREVSVVDDPSTARSH